MRFPTKVKLIIAGNHTQFLSYCHENNISPHDKFVRYINSDQQIRGLRNCEVIYYGDYWNNPVFGHWYLDEVIK